MTKFDFCRTLGILKGQIEDNSRAEIEKYFGRFLVQVKIVEFAFEINCPLIWRKG